MVQIFTELGNVCVKVQFVGVESHFSCNSWCKIDNYLQQLLERSRRMRGFGCSNPSRDRSNSLKQVVTAPRQPVCVTVLRR